MKRTLIIGLGGTGSKVGHRLKKRLLTFFDAEELKEEGENKVAFLFIDNDKNEMERAQQLMAGTNWYDPSDFCLIQPFNGHAYQQRIKEEKEGRRTQDPKLADLHQWMDLYPAFPVGNLEAGMAGNRQLGKLGAHISAGNIRSAVQTRLNKLLKIGEASKKKGGTDSVAIWVIGSICGGTGSSIFLDVAALIDATADQTSACEKRAVLVCPSHFLEKLKLHRKDEKHPLYKTYQRNSWAFIAECDYFLRNWGIDSTLLAQYSSSPSTFEGRIKNRHSFTPFKIAMLMDEQTSTGLRIGQDRFDGFVADMMFEAISGSSSAQFDSEVVNDAGTSYKAIAAKTIEFPRYEYEQYFSQRYVWEVFDRVFAKRDLSPQERDSISDGAVKLLSATESILLDTIELLRQSFSQRAEARPAIGLQPPAPEESYSDKGTLVDDERLEDLFKEHDRTLAGYLRALAESLPSDVRQECEGFKKPFNLRSNAADRLRREVFIAVADWARRAGFHAVVGLAGKDEVRGLLRELMLRIEELRDRLALEAQGVPPKEALAKEVGNARQEIRAAAKGTFRRKKVADLRKELDAYHRSLQKWCEESWRKEALEAEIEILSAFGRSTNDRQGWLQGYFGRLQQAVVPDVSGRGLPNLSEAFDDGKLDGKSIAVGFKHILQRTFADAASEVFRTTIPWELQSLVKDGKWVADSPLAREYDAAVKVTSDEARSIFTETGEQESFLSEKGRLLAFLGEEPNEVGDRLKAIVQAVRDHFRAHYLGGAAPLGRFLGKDVVDVWKSLDQEVKNSLKTSLANPPVPLAFQRGTPPDFFGSTYLTLYKDDKFTDLATNEFQIAAANQIAFDKKELRTRFTFLQIRENVVFEDLVGSDLCKWAYMERALDVNRPHGVSKWNDNREGPLAKEFALAEVGSEVQAKVGGATYTLTGIEMILLCHLLDHLAQANKPVRELLFPSAKYLKQMGWEGRAPLAFDKRTGSFGCWEEHRLEKEGSGSRRFAVIPTSWRQLPLTFEGLEFAATLREVKGSGGFSKALTTFFQFVMGNATRPTLRQELRKPATKAALQKELQHFRESVQDAEQQGSASSVQPVDFDTTRRLPETANALFLRLFGEQLI